MNVIILRVAEDDLDDAVKYYESLQLGLGEQFYYEVRLSLNLIMDFPEICQIIGKRARRCLVSKFPYGIIYYLKPDAEEIVVISIANLHRNPDYWLSRE